MAYTFSRRRSLGMIGAVFAAPLAGCATWIREGDVGQGELSGRVLVEWVQEDRFIYRRTENPLRFTPSFMGTIEPQDMYTDGGSIPRALWGIPGLSPWGLGPAYIIHDWLFQAHRCGLDVPEAKISFRQSAIILAEVGKAMIASGLIRNDLLDEVIWGVSTRYAKALWNKPKPAEECEVPVSSRSLRRSMAKTVVDFTIPPPQL